MAREGRGPLRARRGRGLAPARRRRRARRRHPLHDPRRPPHDQARDRGPGSGARRSPRQHRQAAQCRRTSVAAAAASSGRRESRRCGRELEHGPPHLAKELGLSEAKVQAALERARCRRAAAGQAAPTAPTAGRHDVIATSTPDSRRRRPAGAGARGQTRARSRATCRGEQCRACFLDSSRAAFSRPSSPPRPPRPTRSPTSRAETSGSPRPTARASSRSRTPGPTPTSRRPTTARWSRSSPASGCTSSRRTGQVLADFLDLRLRRRARRRPVNQFHGPFNPQISPDGTKVAFEYFNDSYETAPGCNETTVPPCVVYTQSQGVGHLQLDGFTGVEAYGLLTGWICPHWLSNETLLRSDPGGDPQRRRGVHARSADRGRPLVLRPPTRASASTTWSSRATCTTVVGIAGLLRREAARLPHDDVARSARRTGTTRRSPTRSERPGRRSSATS